jgi:anti-sigma factor RsiW
MRCNDVEQSLMRYLDGRLDPTPSRKIDEHLGVCRRCRELYAEEVELVAVFQTSQRQRRTEGLVAGVMAELEAERVTPTRGGRPEIELRRAPAFALLAAAAAVAWLVAFVGGPAASDRLRAHAESLALEWFGSSSTQAAGQISAVAAAVAELGAWLLSHADSALGHASSSAVRLGETFAGSGSGGLGLGIIGGIGGLLVASALLRRRVEEVRS